jgi:glycosyltransferase involved in cell wall biosynthesis
MEVGQVSHLYRPSIGGIENYVHRLNESIRAAGHDAITFTTDLSLADESPLETSENVHYCRTELAPLRNPLSVELHRTVRRSDCDVYHLHNLWFLSTLVGAHAVPDGAPTVITIHSAEIRNNSPLVRALNVAYRPFVQYVLDRVDHSFVQGETERRRVLDRFDVDPASVSVVPNGIHPEAYDVPDRDVAAFRETYGLDPDVPTVLYVSRLIPEKNPDVFVEAVSERLADEPLQALVVGTGEGSFVRSVKRAADDRVRFLSNLEFQELKTAYHAADVFTFLGTWEGLPTVILEAMNARMPIISTPVGAIPDAVNVPENGQLVPSPPDSRSVATAVRYYLDQPERRATVGEHNREYVRAEYRWADIAHEIIGRYKELVV